MTTARLLWIVVLVAVVLLVLPLYVKWFYVVAGRCAAAYFLEFLMPRVG